MGGNSTCPGDDSTTHRRPLKYSASRQSTSRGAGRAEFSGAPGVIGGAAPTTLLSPTKTHRRTKATCFAQKSCETGKHRASPKEVVGDRPATSLPFGVSRQCLVVT